jgi:hypothetical protein
MTVAYSAGNWQNLALAVTAAAAVIGTVQLLIEIMR